MKRQQGNGTKAKCAASQPAVGKWTEIDWDKCERRVKKLQARTVIEPVEIL